MASQSIASRVAAAASPSSVCCTAVVRELAGGAYAWESAAAHRLEGIDGEVDLFAVRRLS